MGETGIAVVVGAGTMGGGIAADLANAGWSVRLLDVSDEAAGAGFERMRSASPQHLFLPGDAARIEPGTVEAAGAFDGAQWVIEAVAESLEIKRAVLSQIAQRAPESALISTNTSGLGIAAMSAHLPDAVRRRFLGTHFLNPPRYLKLLEVIPTADTDPARRADFIRFAEEILGHRVVVARDSPGFISTRLWIAHLMDTLHATIEAGLDIETVDALTGPALGRPRSATFRMADLVGLDIVASVARNQHALLPDDPLRDRLVVPPILQNLLDTGRTGEKAGAGFYRRQGKEIEALDLTTGAYRPRREPQTGPETDAFVARLTGTLRDYARRIRPEIADDDLAVDRTLRWGFGWVTGPFGLPEPPSRDYIVLDDLPIVEVGSHADVRALDDVLCLALRTKMNVWSPPLLEALTAAIELAEHEGKPLVVAGSGPHFSAGYDLKRLLALLESHAWEALDEEMALCQRTFQRVKYAAVPVVAAIHGYTLGAGCELALHCARIVAARETTIGLPEASVGLIPCGGGVKETLLREGDRAVAHAKLQVGRPSPNAASARGDGWLRGDDRIVANPDRLLAVARDTARALASGYAPPTPPVFPPPSTVPTDNDPESVALAAALSGGLDEAALLESERAAFLALCRAPETVGRLRKFARGDKV